MNQKPERLQLPGGALEHYSILPPVKTMIPHTPTTRHKAMPWITIVPQKLQTGFQHELILDEHKDSWFPSLSTSCSC